ncbi:hypothetical protein D3C85_1383170 [compost metagenome]
MQNFHLVLEVEIKVLFALKKLHRVRSIPPAIDLCHDTIIVVSALQLATQLSRYSRKLSMGLLQLPLCFGCMQRVVVSSGGRRSPIEGGRCNAFIGHEIRRQQICKTINWSPWAFGWACLRWFSSALIGQVTLRIEPGASQGVHSLLHLIYRILVIYRIRPLHGCLGGVR